MVPWLLDSNSYKSAAAELLEGQSLVNNEQNFIVYNTLWSTKPNL